LAAEFHQKALNAFRAVVSALGKQSGKGLQDAANDLINALNNSPDNLRPGAGGTNSSIQGGLDLTQDPTKQNQLLKGTRIVNVDGQWIDTLKAPKNVIRVIDVHERVLITMLTQTFSGKKGELTAYSSGATLQSSDKPKMKSSTMSSANPTPIAIQHPNGVFLFDTQ
jgi:hypothetical protein